MPGTYPRRDSRIIRSYVRRALYGNERDRELGIKTVVAQGKHKARQDGHLDGATFSYVIKVRYTVDGIEYVRRQWIGAGRSVPAVGSCVRLTFEQGKPAKAKLL